jgi:hypothetical protein
MQRRGHPGAVREVVGNCRPGWLAELGAKAFEDEHVESSLRSSVFSSDIIDT